jgi:uncharacterized membrane protein YfcA
MGDKEKFSKEKDLWATLIFLLMICVVSSVMLLFEEHIPEGRELLILIVFVIPTMLLSASISRVISKKIIELKYGDSD